MDDFWQCFSLFSRIFDILINTFSLFAGIILLFTSNVLQDPLLHTNETLKIIVSSSLGWQLFKILQNIFDPDKTAKHSNISNVLRLVTVFTNASTLTYEQNTLLSMLGLVVEPHTIFLRIEKLCRILKLRESSSMYFAFTVVSFLTAVLLRAIFPLAIIVVASKFHLNEIMYMDYIPLAIFFLSLVFFTAANVWLIKISYGISRRSYLKRLWLKSNKCLFATETTIPDFIHNNLWTGKGKSCCMVAINPNHDSQWEKFHRDNVFSSTPKKHKKAKFAREIDRRGFYNMFL